PRWGGSGAANAPAASRTRCGGARHRSVDQAGAGQGRGTDRCVVCRLPDRLEPWLGDVRVVSGDMAAHLQAFDIRWPAWPICVETTRIGSSLGGFGLRSHPILARRLTAPPLPSANRTCGWKRERTAASRRILARNMTIIVI